MLESGGFRFALPISGCLARSSPTVTLGTASLGSFSCALRRVHRDCAPLAERATAASGREGFNYPISAASAESLFTRGTSAGLNWVAQFAARKAAAW